MNPEHERKAKTTPRTARPGGLTFRKNGQSTDKVSYGGVDPTLLRLALTDVVEHGAAIMFGRTMDGGAYSVIVLDGLDRIKEYPHSVEQLNDLLADISQHYGKQ